MGRVGRYAALAALLGLAGAPAFAQPAELPEPMEELATEEPVAEAPAAVEAAVEPGQVASEAEADGARLDADRNLAVITASGSEEQRALASANVTSIGWDEISQRGYHSLAEILADVPGLYVIDDLVHPSVGVRGVTGGIRGGTRIVKIMINGVPVSFRPDLTAFIGPELIPVEMIERVEVAKGPLSALYGANAFLATVNVITRGQSTGAPVIAEASGRMNFARASPGYGGSVVAGFDEGKRSLMVAVSADRFDRSGLSITKTFRDQDPALARYRPFFGQISQGDLSSPVSAFGQFRTQLGDYGSLMLQGGLQRLDSGAEFQLNSVLTHSSRVALENDWVSLRHEKRWSDQVQTSAWLGWSRGLPTREEVLFLTNNRDVSFTRGFMYHAIDGALELSASPWDWLSLKANLDTSYEPQRVLYYTERFLAPQGTYRSGDQVDLIGPNDRRQASLSNSGASLAAVVKPPAGAALSGLSLTANARVDFPNLFPSQSSWRAALAYRWSEAVATKVIAGRAFQAPSASLLFGLPGFGSSNNIIGNRTLSGVRALNPQVVNSIEAVASLQLFGRLELEAGLYGQQVDDKIEFAQAGAQFHARNRGQQRNVGLEASGRYVQGRVWLQLAGSVQRAVVDGYLDDAPPPLFPNARLQGRVNVSIPEAHLNLNAQGSWVGARGGSQSNVLLNNEDPYTLPAFFTTDLTASSLGLNFLGGAQTTVLLSVRNLFDTRYVEPGFGGFDVPSLGRTTVLEVRQAF